MRRLLFVVLLVGSAAPLGAADRPANFVLRGRPRALPEVRFTDGEGRSQSPAAFHGRVVFLSLWATWCPPCRDEMLSLGRLQAMLGGADFEVVALTTDRAGIGVRDLATYVDPSGMAARALGAVRLPTTLLLDGDGREMGRESGPAVWDSPEMVVFLREHAAPSLDSSTPGDDGITETLWQPKAQDPVTEALRPTNRTERPW